MEALLLTGLDFITVWTSPTSRRSPRWPSPCWTTPASGHAACRVTQCRECIPPQWLSLSHTVHTSCGTASFLSSFLSFFLFFLNFIQSFLSSSFFSFFFNHLDCITMPVLSLLFSSVRCHHPLTDHKEWGGNKHICCSGKWSVSCVNLYRVKLRERRRPWKGCVECALNKTFEDLLILFFNLWSRIENVSKM